MFYQLAETELKSAKFWRITKMATTKITKAVNYTDVQTVKLLALYAEGNTTEAIANALGKNVRSIVAKLSREGVYKAKAYVSKSGADVTAKSELAEKICAKANLPLDMADSISKANKQALVGILSALNRFEK